MKSFVLLILLGVFHGCHCGITSRNCRDAIRAYHECTDQAHEAAQIKAMNLGDARTKVEACFTKNGCKKPSPHFGHHHNHQHHRPTDTPPDPDFEKFEQCRRDLAEKFASLLKDCVRKVVDDFELPPLPFGNKTTNATLAAEESVDEEYVVSYDEGDLFEEACGSKGNKEAVRKCVVEVGNATRPSRQQLKDIFEERCTANAQCKKKLGKCDEILKAVDKSICNCNNDISQTKYDHMWQDTPSCARLPVKPDFNGAHFVIDCTNAPKDICDDGFDKFYGAIQNF